MTSGLTPGMTSGLTFGMTSPVVSNACTQTCERTYARKTPNTCRNAHVILILYAARNMRIFLCFARRPRGTELFGARCSLLTATGITLSHNKLVAGRVVLAKQCRRRRSRRRRFGGRNLNEHFPPIVNQVRIVSDVDRVGVETS